MPFIFFFALFFLTSITSISAEKSRPMDEMHGDCSAYKIDLSNEFKKWKEEPTTVKQSASEKISLDQKIKLQLETQSSVSFAVPPGKTYPPEPIKHAGLVSLKVKESGRYLISAGERLWLDLVQLDSKKMIESSTFEMQTKCPTILKAVEYALTADKTYVIQVSGAGNSQVDLLVTKIK